MNEEAIGEHSAEDDASRARSERARLARIFGDVLPETTGDERSEVPSSDPDGTSAEWLKQQRPPHYR